MTSHTGLDEPTLSHSHAVVNTHTTGPSLLSNCRRNTSYSIHFTGKKYRHDPKALTRGRTDKLDIQQLEQQHMVCHATLNSAQCRYRLHFSALCRNWFFQLHFRFLSIDCSHSRQGYIVNFDL